ncbi:unnamed protein product [Caenorhabditis angaria]|uniref:Uncharacterized protein n=1 Tax=Caenorhabditis angaria TaxID=860376 RepID=A0A9P1IJD1_9PELO|nr:unnamed protein product [Caenorhabditis angaria]
MEQKYSQRKTKKNKHGKKDKTARTLKKKHSNGKLAQSGRNKKHAAKSKLKAMKQSMREGRSKSNTHSQGSQSGDYFIVKSTAPTNVPKEEAIRLAPSQITTTAPTDEEQNTADTTNYFSVSRSVMADRKPNQYEEEEPNEVRTPISRTPCVKREKDRRGHENRPLRLAPQSAVPDDDDVNKLIEKYKNPKRSQVMPVAKPSILVDSMVRSKMSMPLLRPHKSPAKEKTLVETQSDEFDDGPDMKTAPIRKEKPSAECKTARLDVIEDIYDKYPKIEEVLLLPSENPYGPNEMPTWMDYLEPTDEDMTNSEPACSVGAEQIEMYHSKKFKLKYPPEKKITLDQWQTTQMLMQNDNLFFTPPLIFSNTIRSLINVASSKHNKSKRDDDEENSTQPSAEAILRVVDHDRLQCYTYLRSDPIPTAGKKVLMKPEDVPDKSTFVRP